MTTYIGDFEAVDSNGNKHIISIFQDWIESTTRGGTQTAPGRTSLKTKDGKSVSRTSKGVYEIVSAWGMIPVTSSDPIAP